MKILVALVLALGLVSSCAAEQAKREVGSVQLMLNGTGKRVIVFFDAYDASLYLLRKCGTFAEMVDLPGPRQLEIRLLRNVRLSMIESVFVEGMADNVPAADLPALKLGMDTLLVTMRRIKTFDKGDVLRLTFTGSATQVELNGVAIGGLIGDKRFNDALMAIWLGQQPIDARLKAELLGLRRE